MMSSMEMYSYMKLSEAENGWILCYDERKMNPMASGSDYDDNYVTHEKKEVFETDENTSKEQALDKALAHYKTLLMTNMEMKTGMNNPGPHNGKKTY